MQRAIRVLEELLGDDREQLLHDAWTVRSLFCSPGGPWRRAGFATRVLVRALVAEIDRLGTLHVDPIDEAFWLLAEQHRYLNHDVVDERVVRVLFREHERLRPSQQRSVIRLLRARARSLGHPEGSPATNLLLLAVLAGSLAAGEASESLRNAIQARFPRGPSFAPRDEVEVLLLPHDIRRQLDERALALDLFHRSGLL